METILNGKLFLNEQRGRMEAAGFRRDCTFNFGNFYNRHKEAFGNLLVFNEEVLAGGARIDLVVAKDCYVVLLPVTGNLICQNRTGQWEETNVGQVLIHGHESGDALAVINPNDGDAIQFLQIWIKATERELISAVYDFEFSGAVDTLMPVTPGGIAAQHLPFMINIGTFEGRGEAVYKMKNPKARFFCFVLAGAFEVQGRLMHALDGLGLWEVFEVEMEALSNNAVILILEQ